MSAAGSFKRAAAWTALAAACFAYPMMIGATLRPPPQPAPVALDADGLRGRFAAVDGATP